MKRSCSSPRILYVSPPWPYKAIRSLHIARALQHVGRVDLMVVDSEGGNWGSSETLGGDFTVVDRLDVQPRRRAGVMQKVKAAVDPRVPYPHGVGVRDEGDRRILMCAPDFDLIWFFKLRTANMFRNSSWPRSIVDVDDLPSAVYETIGRSSRTLKERAQARVQVFSWRRRERLLEERFTVLTVCSQSDKKRLALRTPIHVIPNGFERPAQEPPRKLSIPSRIGFIGLFDYLPNFEGVRWFIDQCWPRIKRELPEARLRLVGRGSDGPLKALGPDIDGLGWLDEAADEIATWSVMVVPVHTGGGTRVKIAEGFSRKCPIVSTGVGTYGYDVEDGKQLRLADSPEGFSSACVEVVRHRAEAERMADRAWNSFMELWTWDAIAPKVWAAAEDCLRRSSGSAAHHT